MLRVGQLAECSVVDLPEKDRKDDARGGQGDDDDSGHLDSDKSQQQEDDDDGDGDDESSGDVDSSWRRRGVKTGARSHGRNSNVHSLEGMKFNQLEEKDKEGAKLVVRASNHTD